MDATDLVATTGLIDLSALPLRELWRGGCDTALDHSLRAVLLAADQAAPESVSAFNSAISAFNSAT